MKSMFEMGIRRMDIFSNPAFGRPYLGQFENPDCGQPDNPCPPDSSGPAGAAQVVQPTYAPAGAAQTVQPTYAPAGAAQTVQPTQGTPPSPGSNIWSDLTKSASIILAPKNPTLPAVRPAAAPAPSSATAVLVGAGLLGAVIAGVVFLT